MSRGQSVAESFLSRLRTKNEAEQIQAARELNSFIDGELKESQMEVIKDFFNNFIVGIPDLLKDSDVAVKKGGIFATVCLLKVETENVTVASNRLTRLGNLLRMILPSSDQGLNEMAVKAIGQYALFFGTQSASLVEYELKKCFSCLSGDRNEQKLMEAVLMLKEFALVTPTFFYQQINPFFETIFCATRDIKSSYIRENAVSALRAALHVTSQREAKEEAKSQWYRHCYLEAERSFSETKEERIHGGLLIFNELLRVTCLDAEKTREEVEEMNQSQKSKRAFEEDQSFKCSDTIGQFLHSSEDDIITTLITPTKHPAFESRTCRKLVEKSFDKICEFVLRNKLAASTPMNRLVLLQIIPRLAAINKESFVKHHLDEAVKLLFFCFSKDYNRAENKAAVFLTFGLLAVFVHDGIDPYKQKIFELIKSQLPTKDSAKKKMVPVDPAVFTCITLLARSQGPEVASYIKDILELMFIHGLCPGLNIALKAITRSIPSLKTEIHDLLLKKLFLVILGKPMPTQMLPPPFIANPSGPVPVTDVAGISLALRTLGSFDFPSHHIDLFLNYIALGYLTSEHPEIRFEAVRTTTRLLRPSVELLARTRHKQSLLHIIKMIHRIVGQILTAGVSDADVKIRLCVFESLQPVFDPHLAQPESLAIIFMGLEDEQPEIREAVVTLLGRLSEINPAYVMPTLRKVLVQIMGELNHSGIGRNKEQSARFLAQLAASSPRFMKPYIQPVIKTLLPILEAADSHTDVLISVMMAIGEIAQVAGDELSKNLDVLIPTLITFLQDASSITKRQVSLWTLGEVISSTGCVVTPYQKYPQLLDILIKFLKTEQSQSIRQETIRVLGILGALDPYKEKVFTGKVDSASNSTGLALSMAEIKSDNDPRQEIIQWFQWERCTLEEFYPAIAVANLMAIVHDNSLAQFRNVVISAVEFIFKNLGSKSVQYIDQVIPSFLAVIRTADPAFREFLFQKLGVLVFIVKQHIKRYLLDIFTLIEEFWTPDTPMRHTIIMLIEQLADALGSDFKPFVPRLMPAMLRVLMFDDSERKTVTVKMLEALQICGQTIEEHLHLLVPPIVKLLDNQDIPIAVKRTAIETVDSFSETAKISDFAPRILHPLSRLLETGVDDTLAGAIVSLLCTLVVQMGSDFLIFRSLIDSSLTRGKVITGVRTRYDQLVAKLSKDGKLTAADVSSVQQRIRKRKYKMNETFGVTEKETVQRLNIDLVKAAWSVDACVSKDDWLDWLRRLSLKLLSESPYASLKACSEVAHNHYPLARDLFNASFIACWTQMPQHYQDELIQTLEMALSVHDCPEITQAILNLAEFMDHSEKGPLLVNPQQLGERALKTRAFAKALRYKEYEFLHKDVTTEVLEALISINNKLQLPEESVGVVEYARKHDIAVTIRERWYEKLHDWDKALENYERKQEQNPDDFDLCLGRMRCLEKLGQWNKLHSLCKEKWEIYPDDRAKFARIAAASAWGLGLWDNMESYTCLVTRNSLDGAFYRAVLAVHDDQYSLAQTCVRKARDLLDTELSALASESYNRSYGAMVRVQMLTELEEVIQYKLVPERRPNIQLMWRRRLDGCQESVEDWYQILQVRSLVLAPQDMRKTWIKFASLCRKNKLLDFSHRILTTLYGCEPANITEQQLVTVKPDLSFSYAKHLYAEDKKEEAIKQVKLLLDVGLKTLSTIIPLQPDAAVQQNDLLRLKAKCYLKLGQWQEGSSLAAEAHLNQIMQCYRMATECDRTWYKAWHCLARSYFDAVLYYKVQMVAPNPPGSVTTTAVSATVPGDSTSPINLRAMGESMISMYAVSAVQCFFKSIALSKGSSLQDTLRLLTIWFDYGHSSDVSDALNAGLKTVPIETWLQVIPQLMARIDSPRQLINRLIIQLLMDIGRAHPQALISPLTVATKSNSVIRQQTANRIIKHMREHSPNLVFQAKLVSDELIRIAILWHELWHEGLEEASRQWFAERNVQGMFATLEPLHAMIELGPNTIKETSFNQAYYRELKEAKDWCQKFQQTGNVKDLTQAWDMYYHVFRRISKQLPTLTSLELQYVSPKLQHCRDLDLAVPGTYDPVKKIIRIASFHSSLTVITSKQRPRKVCIKGSDGLDYWFLLKGHEDPRQDERVMQLFGLVNSLLLQNADTCRRNLTIQRYSIIPLSQNSGLIGWVPNCDTLHALLRDYRDKKKILLNIEHKLMQRMAPDYDHLTLMQKVEVFEHALEHTSGDDLARILWLKSPSSEVWFERRTNYTRSQAVMSMVGYILGLGDRHPSNLMLDRMSGKIVHIDFGDCFEVAMTREKYPEKIPFRLTRMLVNAMEVTGIEGNYRITCERVMNVLRANKDSLMAVLEAFVYDPLINWRLIENAAGKHGHGEVASTQENGVAEDFTFRDDPGGTAPTGQHPLPTGEGHPPTEALNKKALQILQRIRDKLTGRDFSVGGSPCNVQTQVQALIEQATSHENLCQCYIGWCPFW